MTEEELKEKSKELIKDLALDELMESMSKALDIFETKYSEVSSMLEARLGSISTMISFVSFSIARHEEDTGVSILSEVLDEVINRYKSKKE